MTRLFARQPVFALLLFVLTAGLFVAVHGRADAETKPTTAPSNGPASNPASAPSTAPAAAAPATLKVQKGDLTLEVRSDGLFQPIDPYEVKTNFKVYAGPLSVASVAAPGALVRKDEPILTLDRTWIDWNLQMAESDVAVAKAGLAKTEADGKQAIAAEQLGLRQAEDGVKNAEGGKKWFDDMEGPQMLLAAELAVKTAQAAVDDQSDELDQLHKMYQGDQLTTATADIVVKRAIRALEQGKIVLKMQQERRDKTKAFEYPITRQRVLDGVEGAREQLAGTKSMQEQSAVQRTAGLLSAKILAEQAVKKLSDLKEDAAQFQFKSPVDGVLSYGSQIDGVLAGSDPKQFKVGEKLTAGAVWMRVYQPGKMRLALNIPESQAFWVEPGMTAHVTPTAAPQAAAQGKTSAVEQQSKPTLGLTFVENLEVPNVDGRFVPGMRASVVIDAGKATGVLLIPLSALTDGKVQLKQKDGSFADKEVKLGRTDGQQVEVKGGLDEGDEIKK